MVPGQFRKDFCSLDPALAAGKPLREIRMDREDNNRACLASSNA